MPQRALTILSVASSFVPVSRDTAGGSEQITYRLDEADVILICVPTPLTSSRDPDLRYVESTTEAISQRLRPGQLVILESTTYPGTTKEVLTPILEKSGLQPGKDFFVAYSPEREDPGKRPENQRAWCWPPR